MFGGRGIGTLACLASVALFAIFAAGCGSSNDDGDSGNGGAGVSSELQDAAIAAAEEEVDGVEAVELPPQKIGVVDVTGTSEATQRLVRVLEDVTKRFGWQMSYCDGQGDPTKTANCMTTVLGQNPDMIFSLANEPAVINAGLKQAQQKGVPVFNFGGSTAPGEGKVSPMFAGSYYQSSFDMSRELAKDMIEGLDGEGEIGVFTYAALETLNVRFEVLEEELDGTDIEVVANHTTDFANPIVDTKNAATTMLTGNPGLKAFWFATDFNGPPISQAIATVNPNPKPGSYGFFANPSTLNLLRTGQQTAAVEPFIELYAYVTLDQAAALAAKDAEPVRKPQPPYALGQEMYRPVVVDKENVPSSGESVESLSPTDYATFFNEKWTGEYSNVTP